MSLKLGMQLYTLREEIASQGFVTILEKLHDMGYQGVEFAGFHDVCAKDLKSHLDRLNLIPIASHVSIESLENDLEMLITYHQTIDCHYLVCPYSSFENKEELDVIVTILKKAKERLEACGLELLYHNHSHEFIEIEGKYGLDYLLEQADIGSEQDTHWVQRADVEPISYLKTGKERCKLIHIKDLTRINGELTDCSIGEGTMNIAGILKAAESIGHTWAIVENDTPKPNGLECAYVSLLNLKSINKEV